MKKLLQSSILVLVSSLVLACNASSLDLSLVGIKWDDSMEQVLRKMEKSGVLLDGDYKTEFNKDNEDLGTLLRMSPEDLSYNLSEADEKLGDRLSQFYEKWKNNPNDKKYSCYKFSWRGTMESEIKEGAFYFSAFNKKLIFYYFQTQGTHNKEQYEALEKKYGKSKKVSYFKVWKGSSQRLIATAGDDKTEFGEMVTNCAPIIIRYFNDKNIEEYIKNMEK